MHIVLYKDKWYLQIILVSAHVQFVNIFVINDTTQWCHPGGWISQSTLFQQRGAVVVQRSHSELQFLVLAFVWFGPLSTWKMPCQYIARIHPVKTTSAIESEETGPISIQTIYNIYTSTYLQCCRSCLSISTRLLFSKPLFTSTNISLVISSHYISAKGHFHQFYSHKFSPSPFSLIFSLHFRPLVRFRNPPASDIHGSWEPV